MHPTRSPPTTPAGRPSQVYPYRLPSLRHAGDLEVAARTERARHSQRGAVQVGICHIIKRRPDPADRPEKDHAAQLHAFHQMLISHPEYGKPGKHVQLVLIGGSRNEEDAARVEGLRALAKELGIEVYLLLCDPKLADRRLSGPRRVRSQRPVLCGARLALAR